MKNLLVSLIVACVSSTALAESYLCITEAAGGVSMKNKSWAGTAFIDGKKYLLKRNQSGLDWYPFGARQDFSMLAGAGTCVSDQRRSTCTSEFYQLNFNSETLRFSFYLLWGYVDGDTTDTPFVEIGTCSRID